MGQENLELDQKYCYSRVEVEKLAEAIVELKKCEAATAEKDRLIDERLIQFQGPQEGRLFWQDPAWFGFGIAGSFLFGLVAAKMIQR